MSKPLFNIIQDDLTELERTLVGALTSDEPLVHKIGAHLVNSGGKRLRPALCILAARGGDNFTLAHILPLAAALEMIHTASLVHDDVIDAAGTRRGKITANAKWGNQAAILSGDYIFARAFYLVANGNYDSYVAVRLAQLVENLATGEIMQDEHLYEPKVDWNGYYERIKKKTADFLEICCELGAAVGGLPKETSDGLAAYGHAIGMAFQITDDILDTWQDSSVLGKPAGNDIRQGIVTLPTLRALEVSPGRRELAKIISRRDMTEDMVETALSIIRTTDAREFSVAKADEFLQKAKAALPKNLPSNIYTAFTEAADFIGKRQF